MANTTTPTNLNKSDLINNLHASLGGQVTKKAAGEALEAFFENIVTTIQGDGKVTVIGFGTFSKAVKKEREATNPQDAKGPKIHVEGFATLKFKPAKALKMPLKPAKKVAKKK